MPSGTNGTDTAGAARRPRRQPPGPGRGGEIPTGRRFLALDRIDLIWLAVLVVLAFVVRAASPIYPDWLSHPFSGAPVTAAGLGFPSDQDQAPDKQAGIGVDEECAPSATDNVPQGQPDPGGVPIGRPTAPPAGSNGTGSTAYGVELKWCGFVFDEIYFPIDAVKDLHQPPSDYFDPEPPLSKLLMAPAMACNDSFWPWALSGGTTCTDNFTPWRWRIVPSIAGSLFVGLVYLIARRLRRDRFFAVLASGFVAFDGLALVESRTGVIDMVAVFFVGLMYYVFLLHWQARTRWQWLATVYLLGAVAGLAFGAKLTALAPLAVAGGLVVARLLEPELLRFDRVRRFVGGMQRARPDEDAAEVEPAQSGEDATGYRRWWRAQLRRTVVRSSLEGKLWRAAAAHAGIERYVLTLLPVVAGFLALSIANLGAPAHHVALMRYAGSVLMLALAAVSVVRWLEGMAAGGVAEILPPPGMVVAVAGLLAIWGAQVDTPAALHPEWAHLAAIAVMSFAYFLMVQYRSSGPGAEPAPVLGLGSLVLGVAIGLDFNWMTMSAGLAGFVAPRLLAGRLWDPGRGLRHSAHIMLVLLPMLAAALGAFIESRDTGSLHIVSIAAAVLLIGAILGVAALSSSGSVYVLLGGGLALFGMLAVVSTAPAPHLGGVLLTSLCYFWLLERCDRNQRHEWLWLLAVMGLGLGFVVGASLTWLTLTAALVGFVAYELVPHSSDQDVAEPQRGWTSAEHYMLALMLGAAVFFACFARYSTIDHTVYRFTGCSLQPGKGLTNDPAYVETKPSTFTVSGVQLVDVTAVAGNAWDVMAAGLQYHNNECHDHPYSSRWYTWPLDWKPVLFYLDSDDSISTPVYDLSNTPHDSNLISSVSNSGNPALWWIGAVAVLYCAWRMTRRLQTPWRIAFVGVGAVSLALMIISFNHYEHTLLDGTQLDPVRVPSNPGFMLGVAGLALFAALALACAVLWSEFVCALVVLGYLVGWLMWAPGNEKRVLFFYHMLGAVMFIALAAAYGLTALRHTRVQVGLRVYSLAPVAYAGVLVIAASFIFFYPMWTGLPQFSADRALRLWPWLNW